MQPLQNSTAGVSNRYSVLAVDDQPINLVFLKGLLGQGYVLVTAASGSEALEILAFSRFDLVLLDVMMPGIDGFETLRRMRQMPGHVTTPVIFLTASNETTHETTGLSIGAEDYIIKPLVAEHVKLRVAKVLQRQELQKQLTLVLDSAALGIWELDLRQDRILLAPRGHDELDMPISDDPVGWSELAAFIYPEDLLALRAAVDTLASGGRESLDLDVRFLNRAGHWIWANFFGRVAGYGSFGKAIGLKGIYRSIDHRKRIEAAKEESDARLRLVMEATGEGIWDWNVVSGNVTHNASWCQILGLEAQFIEHDVTYFSDLIHPEERDLVSQRLEKCMQDNSPYQSEHRLRTASGDYIWVLDRGRCVERNELGSPMRLVGSIKDISAEKRAEAKIFELAYYDSLTGLPNRRMLMDRMTQGVAASVRTRCRGAVLFIDLDRFKELNDSYGHDAGDELLIQVGQRLKSRVRESDTVARLGGDEFVVFLTGLGSDGQLAMDQANSVAEALLSMVNQPYALRSVEFRTSPSIGLTLFGDTLESVQNILERADRAMYNAKHAGRNCIRRLPEI